MNTNKTNDINSKLPNVGVSIFSEMSGLANQYKAINLSQGFPEFDTPEFIKNKINYYISAGLNQYAPSSGLPKLQSAIADLVNTKYNANIDSANHVTVTSGATEALFVAIQTLVKSGDEVIVFDPAYDSYEPAIELAGGKAIHLQLKAPTYRVNWDDVIGAITPNTKAIIVNTPHNPTGTILTESDINNLSKIITDHKLYLISDEVYEHIVFDEQTHFSALRFEQLRKRAFVISSFGKTFHCTGWKLGYCIAPTNLTEEFRKIHQYVTFSSFTPAQAAIADMLTENSTHVYALSDFYQQKRNVLINALQDSRFKLLPCNGTYFLLLNYSAISDVKDVEFCHWLTKEHGVAAIPLSVFNQSGHCDKIIRLCFAKNDNTLINAAERLCQL
ncbi:aminotransferase class I/II-fold pyridoxal phosphate-dependent enzyme [Pseudoalteromonas sp. C2R02]|uniref:methionine aminotransferase n=1 Tax=Pseudoalteromonas sp. C2R02 TaxID=2841565 RepID=UPI001C09E6F1|nr:methionine aminotransferase [Pseudoalteromonas sp. C2R02]MBU2968299.1 aminotransferase class I/II-fold pyridoxal phosphate-dependent enzyme [Pseudoalteromonas sp. C2R02]